MNLQDIISYADELKAKGKYTEAIKYLDEYIQGSMLGEHAKAELKEKRLNVRQEQSARRKEIIETAEASRNDLSKELEDIQKLYRAATDANLWLDAELESDEYKSLLEYRSKLDSPDSDERADIIVERIRYVFLDTSSDDRRKTDYNWLSRQRQNLESLPNKDLEGYKTQVQRAIDDLTQKAQLYDSRKQHGKYMPLYVHYKGLFERGIKETTEPVLQGDQVIESASGTRVRVRDRLENLEQEIVENSIAQAREHFGKVARLVEEDIAQFQRPEEVWNQSSEDKRCLDKDLELGQIRKEIHLGLYRLNPKEYIPRYGKITAFETHDKDPRPDVFQKFGRLQEASELEKALESALELCSSVERAFSNSSQLSLSDLYKAYHHYSSEGMRSRIEAREREKLKAYIEVQNRVKIYEPETLTNEQRKSQLEELEKLKADLSGEEFYNSPYVPEPSREKFKSLIDFADERIELLQWYERMEEEREEYKRLLEKYLNPFNREEASKVKKQIEKLPDKERAYLEKGLKEQLDSYYHLEDETELFNRLGKAFENAHAAQRDKSLQDLLNSTDWQKYLETWKNVAGLAGRYSDPSCRAELLHWDAGRFYYLFGQAMYEVLESGKSKSEERLSICQDAQRRLKEISVVPPSYQDAYQKLLDQVEEMIKETKDILRITEEVQKEWREIERSLIDERTEYVERDYEKALQIVESKFHGAHRQEFRDRLLDVWRNALKTEINKVLRRG